jgi:hypothetical protein
MNDETHVWSQDLLEQHVRKVALLRVERDERLMRKALDRCLPAYLGWLVDHPLLLRLYLVLPHKDRPFIEHGADGISRVRLGAKKGLSA